MAQKVRIIGVPMDLGQSRRGVDMGPSALRGAGLQASIKKLGLQVEDIGNLSVKQPEELPVGEKRAKYLQEIAETCGDIAAAVEKSLGEGFLPLVLGGDHSIAAGVAAGAASHFRKEKKEIGYLWLDAHGDMNTRNPLLQAMSMECLSRPLWATALPNSSTFWVSSPKPNPATSSSSVPAIWIPRNAKSSRNPGFTSSPCGTLTNAACVKSCPTPSSTPWTTPAALPSASIWTLSIPPMHPVWARRSAAASPTAKPISPWK